MTAIDCNKLNQPLAFAKPDAPEWIKYLVWLANDGEPVTKARWLEAQPHIRWLVRIDENNQAVWADSREG